jgi:hypothetical protein
MRLKEQIMPTMDEQPQRQNLLGYDIDLNRVWKNIRRGRKLIVGCIFGAFLFGIAHLQMTPYTYTATLMVSPVLSSSSNGIAGKLGSLGGVASLAGIDLGGDTGSLDFALYQEGIFSRDVADDLAKDPDIMHTLYGGQWNAAEKRWNPPPDFLRLVVGGVKTVLGMPQVAWQPPSGAELQGYIANSVRVTKDPKKPFVVITYDDTDPQFAVRFLSKLDRAVDRKLRQNAWGRASQYSNYISDQLNKVTNADIRQAMMTALTDQEKIKMMASATAPYAAQPFAPPSASRRPTSPSPMRVLLFAIVLGFVAGIAATLLPPTQRWLARRQPGAENDADNRRQ